MTPSAAKPTAGPKINSPSAKYAAPVDNIGSDLSHALQSAALNLELVMLAKVCNTIGLHIPSLSALRLHPDCHAAELSRIFKQTPHSETL